jgi:hypothetical protein
LSIRVTIRGAEKRLISNSNSKGLQVKLLDLTVVFVTMLPSGRERVRMNGFLLVISQTTCRIDHMLGVKRCLMYELADCSG